MNDDKSKLILINVLLYRIFGHKKIKLQNNEVYFKEISNLEKIKDNNKFIQTEFENFKLYFFDLNNLQIPIYMYFTAIGIYIDFVIKQYSYFNDIEISASKNDIVIDGGGCWGDTSLYFANEVGNHGKVYSFEFVPKNLNIFRKNLSLNQHLCNVIEVIEKPIWNISDKKLYYIDNGPASKISFIKNEDFKGETETISIDDFVIRNKLEKLNFIKLDIEGAELNALLGGVNAIKKFKPNLAIALYHNPIDFYNIPKFINDLNLGYKFYLKHLTIHKEETILFASTN
ncbi:MAG TPA: FkbM family methyltransferase [Ignavibacteria bacterium]|nr:FkbM family methyltransferase [Ignavibacteria bacterium]